LLTIIKNKFVDIEAEHEIQSKLFS